VITFDVSIAINSTPEKIFGFISDYRNDLRWREKVTQMIYLSNNGGGTGSKLRETLNFLGKNYTTISEVTEFHNNKRIAFNGSNDEMRVSGFREIFFNDLCYEFRYYMVIEPKGINKLLLRLIKNIFCVQIKKDLKNLKDILENS
jgi:hypothetical protein